LDHQGFVRVAMRSAFWHAIHSPTFEAGVASVVLRGGDADTVGSITGALLGALHGEKGIPRDWIEGVMTARPTQATKVVGEQYHPRLFFAPLPIEEDAHHMDDFTRLSPRDSGTGFIICVYSDFTHSSCYDPCITVFPGRCSAGGGVTISVPTDQDLQPKVVSGVRSRFSVSDMAKVIAFVRRNRQVLLRSWNDDLYATSDLLRDLRPVG
jgi:hypothetical protein